MKKLRRSERRFTGSRTPRKRFRRSVYILPSLFTVGNMFAGFFALVSILNEHYQAAAVAIGIAVVLDGLDGRVARLANATSDFGVQLDSLADVVSFGVAPAVLIYSWGLADLGNFARFSAFFFFICGAVRLARFNVQLKEMKYFAGLPIPAAAAFVAAIIHFFETPPDTVFFKVSLVGMNCAVACLMVSTVRYPSFKRLNLGGRKSHLLVVILALMVAAVFFYSRQSLMAMASGYLLSGVVLRGYQYVRYRLKEPAALEEQEVRPD